jgi:hypothetical protein
MKQDNLGFFAGLIFAIFLSVLTVTTCFKLIKVATSRRSLPVKQYEFKKVRFAFWEKKQ